MFLYLIPNDNNVRGSLPYIEMDAKQSLSLGSEKVKNVNGDYYYCLA